MLIKLTLILALRFENGGKQKKNLVCDEITCVVAKQPDMFQGLMSGSEIEKIWKPAPPNMSGLGKHVRFQIFFSEGWQSGFSIL